jgi:hypothetical protein
MSMKRIAFVAALAFSLAGAGGASASHLGCGLPATHPLWIDFADHSVDFRMTLFARPGLVLATARTGAEELRARGAHTVFWNMHMNRVVGTGPAPADPATVVPGALSLYDRAVAATGCATPVIALNELWGAYRPTPWTESHTLYRANVLTLLRTLAAKGAVPFLLVPGAPRKIFVDGDARVWWLEAAKHAHIIRQMHFHAPKVYRLGPIVGPRKRRVAMRTAIWHMTAVGIPVERLGLLVAFQSGLGKGGREGLRPTSSWLEIIKQDVLAARHVSTELGVPTVWSWGWGTFGPESVDPDKPRAACVYLWTRDPTLCDGPAVAGQRFNASLTLGQIQLAAGTQCQTGIGSITTADFEEALAAFDGRRAALTALLSRLVYLDGGADPPRSDVANAERLVVERGFGGDAGAYRAALAQLGVSTALGRKLIADQLRRQEFEAVVQVRHRAPSPLAFTIDRQQEVLDTTICLRDEIPGVGIADPADRAPFLQLREGSISIKADRYRVKRGMRAVLRGDVDSDRASEIVTIYARGPRSSSYAPIGTRRVEPGSTWSFQVRPAARTSYRAVSKSAASVPIVIHVTR